MPNTRTSDENSATTLDGSELVRIVQAGSNAKATGSQFAALVTTPLADTANGHGVDMVGGAARYVSSVAILRTLLKTGIGRAITLGYYAPGDGGGGTFYYDSTDTTSADNGGTIIVATDGGRWKRIVYGNMIAARAFGAKADTTTDDTAALLAAIASGIDIVECEDLSYKVTASITRTFPAGAWFKLRRFKFISSGVPDNTAIVNLQGSSTPTKTLSISAAAAGSTTLTVVSGTLSPGDKLQVRSDDKWNDVAVNTFPTVTMAEWAEVKSFAGATATLQAPLWYDYTTNPVVDVMPLAEFIGVEDGIVVSDNTSRLHIGVNIGYASNISAYRVRGNSCSNAGLAVNYFHSAYDEDCGNFDPDASLGFAYGVVVSGTSRTHMSVRPRGRGCRHITAHGGYQGVVTESTIIDPQGDNQFEGIVDAHAAVNIQNVQFGSTSQFTSVNGKLISSQARRLTVNGARAEALNVGIAWTPACTAYPVGASFVDCHVKCKTNALQINIATNQSVEYVDIIGGSYEAALYGSSSGDALQFAYASNLTTTGVAPGTIGRIRGVGVKYSGFRGFYFFGNTLRLKCTDINIDGEGSSGTAAGSRPFFINPNTAGDVGNVTLRGVLDGGVDYNAQFYNCQTIDADVLSRNYVTDVYFNNQNAASDALNRFNLRARMLGDGTTPQRFGTVTANGTTAVATSNKYARSGSLIRLQLKTPAGTTPGGGYPFSSATGTFSIKSISTTDTSVYQYEILNPITGP